LIAGSPTSGFASAASGKKRSSMRTRGIDGIAVIRASKSLARASRLARMGYISRQPADRHHIQDERRQGEGPRR
jgi:hypothetical protein